jgi:probable HAF family extracellular repeat protein
MQDLGSLGGNLSVAYGINASGQVVGYSYTTSNASRLAFLYTNGQMQDLGSLGGWSDARGINASGQVVGWSSLAGNAPQHAFLYTNGQMQDLNSLVDLPPGVSLEYAYGINDQGWIVGQTSSGHAYLLTPIPGAFWLLGSGLLGLVGWRRFRKS